MTSDVVTRWRPLLADRECRDAIDVARDIAQRLSDPDRVHAVAVASREQTSLPESIHWLPYGIAQGDAGLAVTFGHLDACFPDESWDQVAHRYLQAGSQPGESLAAAPAGLFAGFSGLAFSAWYASRGRPRYRKLLSTLESTLIPLSKDLACDLETRSGVAVRRFDVISGLTGIGAFLLLRKDDPDAASALGAVLRAVIALSDYHQGLPRWHTPHVLLDSLAQQSYDTGYVNCGLAHGVPGPLALMALAALDGVRIPGIIAAIRRAADDLLRARVDDDWGVNWPNAIPIEASRSPIASRPSRAGWCYGSPGIARSLWLAGRAVNDAGYGAVAVEAMRAVYDRPVRVKAIDSPGLCHGVSGLLQITLQFWHDTGDEIFRNAGVALCDRLLSMYEPDSPLGYRSVEPAGVRIDQPGLLDGAAGIPLVLLAAATDVEPSWDRLFLLS